jgi:hypothetical protein
MIYFYLLRICAPAPNAFGVALCAVRICPVFAHRATYILFNLRGKTYGNVLVGSDYLIME